jgi:endoglucanase
MTASRGTSEPLYWADASFGTMTPRPIESPARPWSSPNASSLRQGLGSWLSVFAFFCATACSQGTAARNDSDPSGVAGPPGAGTTPASAWMPPAAPPADSPVAQFGQLQVVGTHLADAAGANVQLKGVSSMWLNWESRPFSQNKEGLGWMRDNWNLSLIRAAMGVEPSGAYLSNPAAAKAEVRTIVQNAIDQGVYVLIDWHDHHAHLHAAEAVSFFEEMAQMYGAYPNVIYEPFNEPNCALAGDTCDAAGRLAWPELKLYHEQVVAAIRKYDPDNVIVLGTPTWSQDVDQAAADPLVGSHLMYTLHFYSCTHQQPLIDRADQALAMGLPLFVTEWGATHADGGLDQKLCLPEAQLWHDWMDTHAISWAAWKFDACQDSACFFASPSVPLTGGWTDAQLAGHAPFVRDRMLE